MVADWKGGELCGWPLAASDCLALFAATASACAMLDASGPPESGSGSCACGLSLVSTSTSMGGVEGATVTTGVVCGGVGRKGREGKKVVAGVGWV